LLLNQIAVFPRALKENERSLVFDYNFPWNSRCIPCFERRLMMKLRVLVVLLTITVTACEATPEPKPEGTTKRAEKTLSNNEAPDVASGTLRLSTARPGAWPSDAQEAARRQEEAAKAFAVEKELSLDLGNAVIIRFALIPAGKFIMGSPPTEKGRRKDYDETRHETTISKPFYLGVYEVTQQQYEAVTGSNHSSLKSANNPVERVSWQDCVQFCDDVSNKTGMTVRLPTEAEWEYACRAGTDTSFYFGDDESRLDDYAWYSRNSGRTTHPVGEKAPNAWGLYDMYGNVAEWCSDWYGNYPEQAVRDPLGPDAGPGRIVRGASYTENLCRSAARFSVPPGFFPSNFGFRVLANVKTAAKVNVQ